MAMTISYEVSGFTVNAAFSAALRGQAQEKAANEATGHDDVPLYKVCGLQRKWREKQENEQIRL